MPSAGKEGCVLFDFDGTLVDVRAASACSLHAVSHLILREHKNLHRGRLYETLSETSSLLDAQGVYDRRIWWKKTASTYGLEVTESQLLRYTVAYWTTYARMTRAKPEGLALVDRLKSKGTRIGIVTNTDGWRGGKRWRLSFYPAIKEFESVVVAGEDTSNPKPSPDGITRACRILEADPEGTVYIGDDPFKDATAAEAAGVGCLIVDGGSSRGAHTGNRVADLSSVAEFLGL
ncbi:MAG: HAD hydrolase-like protein [Thermoprotei archaeon]